MVHVHVLDTCETPFQKSQGLGGHTSLSLCFHNEISKEVRQIPCISSPHIHETQWNVCLKQFVSVHEIKASTTARWTNDRRTSYQVVVYMYELETLDSMR